MQNSLEILKSGGVGVIPTDTIYGLSGQSLSKKTVEIIYKIKGKDPKKPLIILIESIKNLSLFDIKVSDKTKKILSRLWPGKISIILPCPSKKFQYLHRGTKTLAFRLPAKARLRKLLKTTGPLLSTSANPTGKPFAKNTAEAKRYFGDKVDFYSGQKNLTSLPSTLISIKDDGIIILRQGSVKIK